MSDRANNGRFLPGHNSPGPGRPSRAHEEEVLAAIRSHFPPEKIISLLNEALEISRKTNSARGVVSVVVDVLDRTIGRAVQRVEQPTNNLAELLAQLPDDE